MKEFFYRLSWDNDYKHSVTKWFTVSFVSFACVLAISVVCVGNFMKPYDDNESFIKVEEEDNEDGGYNLEFSERQQKKTEKDNQQKQNNTTPESNHESGGGEGGGGTGGGDTPGHVHSWHWVVDSPPWDEEIWIQTGTRYICTGCGFTTTSSDEANIHSMQTGHKFVSEAIMERRIIHHDGSGHDECDCGARR